MDYKIEEISLSPKLKELKLAFPSTLTFFPENIEEAKQKEDFVFTDSMLDLNKLFSQDNLDITILGANTELYRTRKNADIYLPAFFFSLSLITENPLIVSISLNVLSNYVYDLCKGSFGKKTAKIDLYIETKEKGKIKKISYSGDSKGLKDLEKIIKAMR